MNTYLFSFAYTWYFASFRLIHLILHNWITVYLSALTTMVILYYGNLTNLYVLIVYNLGLRLFLVFSQDPQFRSTLDFL